jgi:hypothetical protein
MRVTTSDNPPVVIDGFERLQGVVDKIRKAPVIKSVSRKEDVGYVMYNGHSIQVWDQNRLETQIPRVLDNMRRYSWNGEIYRKGKFEKKFANCLNFLLAWLESIRPPADHSNFLLVLLGIQSPVSQNVAQVGIVASQVRSAIRWVYLIMRRYELEFSEGDFVCVERMINSF